MFREKLTEIIVLVESFKALVPEPPDHNRTVNCKFTFVKAVGGGKTVLLANRREKPFFEGEESELEAV